MAERAGLALTTIPLRTYARYVYDTGGVSTLAKNVVKPGLPHAAEGRDVPAVHAALIDLLP